MCVWGVGWGGGAIEGVGGWARLALPVVHKPQLVPHSNSIPAEDKVTAADASPVELLVTFWLHTPDVAVLCMRMHVGIKKFVVAFCFGIEAHDCTFA